MIQFKRLTTSTNINSIQLEAGQPLVDLKNSYLYIGKGSTNKLKFYDSVKVDAIESSLNSHIDAAKQSLNELKTSVDTKVDTIEIMSRNPSGGGTTSNSVTPTNGSITFTPGMNVQLEVKDDEGKKVIEISSSYIDTQYDLATETSKGLMSPKHFKKLEGIDAGANKYTLPSANADNLGGIKVKSVLKKEDINGDNHKYYWIDIDPDGKAVVDVPWTDTTYSAGSNITLDDSKSFSLNKDITVESINCATITSTGNIEATGNSTITAYSFNAKSDRRLKENIIDYKPEKSILDLPIKKFDFIDGPKNQIGCIAQDLKEICPEIVNENEKGYLSIQENKLIYLLLDEVKKLKNKVDNLEG